MKGKRSYDNVKSSYWCEYWCVTLYIGVYICILYILHICIYVCYTPAESGCLVGVDREAVGSDLHLLVAQRSCVQHHLAMLMMKMICTDFPLIFWITLKLSKCKLVFLNFFQWYEILWYLLRLCHNYVVMFANDIIIKWVKCFEKDLENAAFCHLCHGVHHLEDILYSKNIFK